MIKTTVSAIVIAMMLAGSHAFAGDRACCAKSAHNKTACANFATLNLTADQKSKLDAWQSDCMKAGCTEKSRAKFLRRAKRILSADQYAKVKAMCSETSSKKGA